MTSRQQLARLLSVALLVVLVIAGLRGAVAGPRWNGPLRAEGVAIGLILEVILGVLLVITIRRDLMDLRSADHAGDTISVPSALRFVLRWVLGLGIVAIGVLLIAELHLHWFTINPSRVVRLKEPPSPSFTSAPPGLRGGGSSHFPIGPVLYGLLIAALVAAVAISIRWAARQRRPALPGHPAVDLAEDSAGLRDAVESGRAALAQEIDDARAAIIACYLAMERTLAERGAARGVADTPDELLARAVRSRIVRGAAARRLTALFYEARYSSHQLGPGQRLAASSALDDLAAELRDGELRDEAAAP